MNPLDIPTEITKLVYTAPEIGGPATGLRSVSQNDMAKLLAHFWPAIEAHLREQIATEIENDVTPAPWRLDAAYMAPGFWMDRRDAAKAAAIARGTHTT